MKDKFPDIDIAQNRKSRKYRKVEMVARVTWGVGQLLFRFSPRICFGWRRFLLRLFGAKVGKNVHIYNSAVIYLPWKFEIGDWSSIGESVLVYNLGHVKIGQRTTVSQRVHICAGTHDHTRTDFPLIKDPVDIGNGVWLCADSFIGPGVTVAEGAIAGARSVVVNDIASCDIVAGNPAKKIGNRKMQF